VAAASLGAGAYWASRPPAGSDSTAASIWTLNFETPQGAVLPMASFRGKPLLVNFWATWCPPCVKEMPQLDRFYKAYSARGWQVVGIAIDRAEAVKEFLAKTPVGFPIALGGLAGTDLARNLGNVHGALPFTAVFSASGSQTRRKLGETHFDELVGWANAAG
jgi:thiol-disulfide isomerase/thioredoxin